MKTTCDHCGATLTRSYPDEDVVWCQLCVHEFSSVLNGLGLDNSAGYSINYNGSEGNQNWGLVENVRKLLTVPKIVRDSNPKLEPATKPVEATTSTPQEATGVEFDFHTYNTVLPGQPRYILR